MSVILHGLTDFATSRWYGWEGAGQKSSEIGVVVGPGEGPDTPAVHAVIGRSGSVLDVASYRKTHLKDFGVEDVLTLEKLSVPIRMTTVWAKDARLRS